MKRYGLVTALVGVLCVAAGLADVFYYLGGGLDLCWQSDVWQHSGNRTYPSTMTDSAIIGYPYAGESWTVGLNTEDVGVMDIYDDVTFDACETSPILTVGVIWINGPDDVEDEYVTVEMAGGRIITSE